MKLTQAIFIMLLLWSCAEKAPITGLVKSPNDLHFDKLSNVWDEAIPLGNGMIGALIWEKEGKLRFSLDRADLWDLRPMENLKTPEWKFSWVYEQWKKNDYKPVQENFDVPYDRSPAPSKIPGAALEFDVSALGEVASVHLYVEKAVCEVVWKNGVRLLTFVHATEPVGWYRFEGLEKELEYELIPPAYNVKEKSKTESPVTGQDLRRLEYPEGKVTKSGNSITYEQEGWGGFRYQANVTRKMDKGTMKGCWSMSSEFPGWDKKPSAQEITDKNLKTGIANAFTTHKDWWKNFWSKSAINVPDSILQKQWHLEQYKFGSAARADAPPISLQAVWTADNGKLPPWKGDFHHDLNTQLSYWPAYSGNHLEEEIGFLDWLWKYKDTFKKYTQDYYETEGLNVPGVSTLTGDPMGGWIQYSFGPTVSAWLGQHFYLHWRYSMDREFLKEKAYPWIKDVSVYLNAISVIGDNGLRKLSISSSPEMHNNSKEAWFDETTNFDLALVRWTFEKASELASELNLKSDAEKWMAILEEWPQLAIDTETGLMIAPGVTFDESHRHFSHQLGYHPLGVVDFSKGKEHQKIIENTIKNLDNKGTDWWTGYSFAWMGGLKARAFDGQGAVEYLLKFATSFCLPNSFHVNGDQSGTGLSKFTYRPFTLEGNFAFASALQEMLIQSHTGVIHIFPAIPASWKDASFDQLRTEGAFLISVIKEKGQVITVDVKAEQGGTLKLKNPFGNSAFECSTKYETDDQNTIIIKTSSGDKITLNIKL
ncbi:glycoside hydrolase family 95-like protein [Reichenbachiella sp. MALMAid0571]|uniref:glycosyl hydrolase family 95 catalytic domain-containing protein n=1 Tax=Reichenbachiella sp. MALMAid0571 TaxID=3143939 RepID=UPI0032DFCB2A